MHKCHDQIKKSKNEILLKVPLNTMTLTLTHIAKHTQWNIMILSDHDICALIYVSLLFYYHILNCYEVVFIFLFITCYRVPCSLFCVGMFMLFTYIPLYYMLQGTMQLILCWNVDVIYVYPSLLLVTGYHAAYSVLECWCYLRISFFITCYRVSCCLFLNKLHGTL
jgi:hypothetical protein